MTPDRAWAPVDDHEVVVRFGRFELHVAPSDIVRSQIEGPWRWIAAS